MSRRTAPGYAGSRRRVLRSQKLSGDLRRRDVVMLGGTRIGCAGGMGKDSCRIGKRKDFENDEGRNIEEWIATPQSAADQTKIFATHDSIRLLEDTFFADFG